MKYSIIIIVASLIVWLAAATETIAQPSSQVIIDSMQKELSKAKNEDTTRVSILNQIAFNYYAIDPQKGLSYARQALRLAQKLQHKTGIALAHNCIGLNYWSSANYSAAMKNLRYALEIYQEVNDTAGIVKIRGNIALIYFMANMPTHGIQQLLTVKNINPKYKDTTARIMNLVNIAGGYRELKDYTRSLQYYNDAIREKTLLNVNKFDFHIYLNRAMTLAKLRDYNTALQDLNIARKIKSNFGMGDKYVHNMWDSEYSGLIINYFADTLKHKSIIPEFERNKKSILSETQKRIEATIEFYQMIQAPNEVKNSYFNYSALFRLLKNSDSALHYYTLANEITDSIIHKNAMEVVRLIDVDKEIAMQKNEILRESKYNHYYRIAIAIGIIFIIIMAIGILYQIKIINRNKILNATLNEKNEQIMQTNTELEIIVNQLSEKQLQIAEVNNKLHEANKSKDKFFSIISHDLRSPFSGLIGLSDLLANDVERIPQSELQNIGRAINSAAKNTFAMLNSLLEWAKTQMGVLKYNPSDTTADEILKSAAASLTSIANAKGIHLQYDTAEEISLLCDADMISTVLRNLITNAIKFTNPGGRILATAIRDTGCVKFCIKDNGVGMSQEIINDLFKTEKVITTKGTNSEVGTGLGLLLCKEFIDMHRGSIWAESQIGQGTTFFFTIPISE